MYSVDYLTEFTRNVFIKMGCSEEDAITIADVFIAAELRGIPSHGMIRIKDYFQLWLAGRINTMPDIKIIHESPGTASVDGDNAIGMVASVKSMQIAIEKAKTVGTGWVSTMHSNHFGIAGYYAMMALEHDMIGICMTNANPLVAPTFSLSRLLGTNPLAVAIPTGSYLPFVADFATTPIARGKLAIAAKKGEQVPLGYVQDKDGNPSDDPDILTKGGSMLTLGGDYEHGSHKGYCLSSVVDIFSAILSGANFGPFVPPSVAYLPLLETKVGEGTGHFFGAMRIDGFRPANEFKAAMDKWVETFKKAKTTPDIPELLIPGEKEFHLENKTRIEGIHVITPVIKELKDVANQLGVEFNEDK